MRELTLTFDNGPDAEVTPFVLDTLAARGIKATFFVIGRHGAAPGALALMERAHAEGHWIGNHTWTHSVPLGQVEGSDVIEAELARTQRLIGGLAHEPKLFRPSGGGGNLDQRLLNRPVVDYLCANRFTCVLWNAVPRDWNDPDGWMATAFSQLAAQPWSLLVLHDRPGGAMRHLPKFLDDVAAQDIRIRQDFPPDCLPITAGEITGPIDQFTTCPPNQRRQPAAIQRG